MACRRIPALDFGHTTIDPDLSVGYDYHDRETTELFTESFTFCVSKPAEAKSPKST